MSEGRIRRLFCFGLGYSARVLAQQLAAEGWQIAGTGRSEKSNVGSQGYDFHTFD